MCYLHWKFTVPNLIACSVPAEQREALLKDFRRNIRKRQDDASQPPSKFYLKCYQNDYFALDFLV